MIDENCCKNKSALGPLIAHLNPGSSRKDVCKNINLISPTSKFILDITQIIIITVMPVNYVVQQMFLSANILNLI